MAVKQLIQEQAHDMKGYADALEHVVTREEKNDSLSTNLSGGRKHATQDTQLLAERRT